MMYKIRPKDEARVIADWAQVFDHFDHDDRIGKGLSKLHLCMERTNHFSKKESDA